MLPMIIAILAAANPTTAPIDPPTYDCKRANAAIKIDGKLDDAAWSAAAWSGDFVNIAGRDRPAPAQRTRAKLLWDDQHLYLAAELAETDVRAELRERDDFLYLENAFEVFLDPDDDARQYAELEFNALGTIFDVIMNRPFRERGHPKIEWRLEGLQLRVHVDGTLNEPKDVDRGWTLEMAIPWKSLGETGIKEPPAPGSRWRMNLARVSYQRDSKDSAYSTWSPQGEINMHLPKKWGWLKFNP
jgi:hypothetical protein